MSFACSYSISVGVAETFGLATADSDGSSLDGTTKKTRYYSKKGNSIRNRTQVDEHNEVCEVCDKGGDLLCCDTCTLVFHLQCLRPKITSVPKGTWSCAHCILDVCILSNFVMQNRILTSKYV
jgi:hypothetical protein